MQPHLRGLLDRLTKIIVDKERNMLWSSFSLLYGYCNLCETCSNEGSLCLKSNIAKIQYNLVKSNLDN